MRILKNTKISGKHGNHQDITWNPKLDQLLLKKIKKRSGSTGQDRKEAEGQPEGQPVTTELMSQDFSLLADTL